MGLLGHDISSEYGGAGLGYVDYVLAIEELSAVDGSLGLTVARTIRLGRITSFLPARRTKEEISTSPGQRRLAGGMGNH